MTWCDRIKHDVPAWKPGQIHVPLLRLCLILGGDALWTWQFLSILSSSWKAHERWDFMDRSTSCTDTHSPPFPSTDVSAWQPKHWVALSFTPARSTLPAGSRRYLQLKGFATFQVRLLLGSTLPPSAPLSNPVHMLNLHLAWICSNTVSLRRQFWKTCFPHLIFLYEKQCLAELIRAVNNTCQSGKTRVQDLASASRIFGARQGSKQAN